MAGTPEYGMQIEVRNGKQDTTKMRKDRKGNALLSLPRAAFLEMTSTKALAHWPEQTS